MTSSADSKERSIFSYPPPCYKPSAREVAQETNRSTNDDDSNRYDNIIDCPPEIHCTLPDGIKVENHPTADGMTNWGLYASKTFPKHSVIYIRDFGGYVHDKNVDYKLIIEPGGISIPLNVRRHLVGCAKGVRTQITYGSLTNHSCDPTAYSDRTYPGLQKHQETAVVALRDIHPDEEITMDYNLAIYAMKNAIDPCYCHTPLCRGAFQGFKFLNETEQEKLLPYAKWNVQLAYWKDKQEQQ